MTRARKIVLGAAINFVVLMTMLVLIFTKGWEPGLKVEELERIVVDGVAELRFAPDQRLTLVSREGSCLVIEDRSLDRKPAGRQKFDLGRVASADPIQIRDELTGSATPNCDSSDPSESVRANYAVSRDGRMLAAGAQGTIVVAPVFSDDRSLLPEVQRPLFVTHLAFWGDDELAVLTQENGFWNWEYRRDSFEKIETFPGQDSLLADGRFAVITDFVSHELRILSRHRKSGNFGQIRVPLDLGRLSSIALNARAGIVLGTSDGYVRYLDLAGNYLDQPIPLEEGVSSLALSDDGRVVAGGNFRGIYLVSRQRGARKIRGVSVPVRHVAINGDLVAYSTENAAVVCRLGETKLTVVDWFVSLAVLSATVLFFYAFALHRGSRSNIEKKTPPKNQIGPDPDNRSTPQKDGGRSETVTSPGGVARPPVQPFDVFLSHNSKDKTAVRALAEELRTRGLRVWLDEWELVPGRPWQEALEGVIEAARSAVVLIGRDGLGPWEVPEMRACLSEFVTRGMPVIPVLLPGSPRKPSLPLFLQQLTWVDLSNGLTEEGVDRLVWGITGRRT